MSLSTKPLIYSGLSVLAFSMITSCRSVGSSSRVSAEISAGSPGVEQQTYPQIARFTYFMDKLDKDMKGLTPAAAADRLVAGNARETAFNLQALGRLYEALDPQFTNIRKAYKKLEDGIGDFAKWVELLDKAQRSGAPAEIIAQHKASRDKARITLEQMLISSNFVPSDVNAVTYHQTLNTFLAKYPWKPAAVDRADMIKRLYDDLQVIKSAPYDFSHLEEGDGVHEFRRKMRWFPMEARALNGMVLLKPKTTPCPIPEYANLVNEGIAQHKYSVLPASAAETNPVYLTPCLYIQISKLVDVVGAIKGNIEEIDNNSNTGAASDGVAAADQLVLTEILKSTLANNLFGRLQEELIAAQTFSDKQGVRMINAQNPNFCFNTQLLNGVKTTDVFTCSSNADQLWDLTRLESGYYRIKNNGKAHCVNLKTSNAGDETKGTSCIVHPDQSWKVLNAEAGLVQFESQRSPGLCLSMNKAVDGSRTIVKTCDNSDKSQLWNLK
ncbi:MAG: hypothetical protein EOP07_07915 [Proteobacteria bacterium]|nr:MAG: hypothetical protein EOP07_07915 [Pseudomonadota bacterium]